MKSLLSEASAILFIGSLASIAFWGWVSYIEECCR